MASPLDQIIEQENVKTSLSKFISSKRIPHALIFKGAEGIGKENTAIQFAKALTYNQTDSDNRVLQAIDNLSEPYLKFIFALPRGKNETDQSGPFEKLTVDEIEHIKSEIQKKSSNHFYKIDIPRANIIKINSIRDINKFLSLSYDEDFYRVVLISNAHLMNDESQNALLKNLEEPPKGIIFILCTHHPERLRETIRSRCWTLEFNTLSNESVSEILISKFKIDKDYAENVASFASGSVINALNLLEYDFELLKDKVIKILRYSFGKKYLSAYTEFEELMQDNDQNLLQIIIQLLMQWLNDLIKFKTKNDGILFVDHIDTFQKFNSRFPEIDVMPLVNKLDNLSSSMRNNINLNLAVSNIIFELSSVIPRK